MKQFKHKFKIAVTLLTAIFFTTACAQNNSSKQPMEGTPQLTSANPNLDSATFGAGCFWCVEAVFQQLNGVKRIESGYSGGTVKNPAYREVCNGTTGHAEVCRIVYDKTVVSFDELLEVFWKTHDPTTLNQQGNDHGTQYRSVIFYHNDDQYNLATKYKEEINGSGAYPSPVVTEISPLINYYKAEDYHQNYYKLNGQESYCKFVIQPKVEKFEKIFKNKVKK